MQKQAKIFQYFLHDRAFQLLANGIYKFLFLFKFRIVF